MKSDQFSDRTIDDLIRQYRIIAIMRHIPDDQLIPVFRALADAGIRMIEITMNTQAAFDQIRLVRTHFAGEMLIGAGTVTTLELAQEAIDAGARFLVTPNLNLQVLQLAKNRGCPVIPGVMTPTEMAMAAQAGARVLKLFPAGHLGPGYVKDVLAPLDDICLIAVGGVTPDNMNDWLRAGCIGVGMGSSLIDPQLLRECRYEELGQRTQRTLQMLKQGS